MNPATRLVERWPYFVRDADRAPAARKPVREITFLDPACGSGHFLIVAFDLFFDLYQEEGEITDPVRLRDGSVYEHCNPECVRDKVKG